MKNGAEKLLGRGDMLLFKPIDEILSVYIAILYSDDDVRTCIVNFIKAQADATMMRVLTQVRFLKQGEFSDAKLWRSAQLRLWLSRRRKPRFDDSAVVCRLDEPCDLPYGRTRNGGCYRSS